MQGGFEGRVALVAGAAVGIGAARRAAGLTPAAIAVWLAMSGAETDREGQWAGRIDFR